MHMHVYVFYTPIMFEMWLLIDKSLCHRQQSVLIQNMAWPPHACPQLQ